MLTSERVNGIKTGYWSQARKELLVQKLGGLERRGPGLLAEACRGLCQHKGPLNSQDAYCAACLLWRLMNLMEEDPR